MCFEWMNKTQFQFHPLGWRLCMALCVLGSFFSYAQQERTLEQTNQQLEALVRSNDTTALADVLQSVNQSLTEQPVPAGDRALLRFRMLETRYLINYSKITIDSGLQRYEVWRNQAQTHGHYDLEAYALGRMANASRSKRQLGRAFDFNQQEIEAARKSGDSLLVGRALITELDIFYNSLLWPIQREDLQRLIDQGIDAIAFAKANRLSTITSFGQLYVSKFYIEQGEYRKADSILQGISDQENLSVTFSKYEHLSEIAKLTDDLEAYRNYTLEFKKRAYRTKRPFVALNAHNYLLDYSLRVSDEDSATYYAQQLEKNLTEVDTTQYLDFLDITYATLARYYENRDPKKQLQYVTNSAEVNRIIAARQREAFAAVKQYKDQVSDLQEVNTDLLDSNTFIKNNLVTVIVVSVLLTILLILLLMKYRRSRSQVIKEQGEREKLASVVLKKNLELNNKQRVYLEELRFIKSDKNYVEFHTPDKTYLDRNRLTAVLKELPPNFIQVHRSYVINRNFIKTSNSTHVVLDPDIEIPISRTFKAGLQASL